MENKPDNKSKGNSYQFFSSNYPVRHIFVFAILAIFIVLIYSNTFHSPWHLDDSINIVQNENIHLDNFELDSLKQSLYSWSDNKSLYRPVANFSFALNWFFGQDKVVGYHMVNTLIHIVTAFYLYLFIFTLLQTKNISKYFSENRFYIAFFVASLWAVHPIQTQAVTYVVQRMTSLAAMFYILSMYLYLLARLTNSYRKRPFFFTISLLCFVLSFLSKENGFLLPGSVILVEWIFLTEWQFIRDKKSLLVTFFSSTLLMIFLGWFVQIYCKIDLLHIFSVTSDRSFTAFERLLTEPRIVLFYLSQIFYPLSSRFSLEHDVIISTSLITPWTTFPAILFIVFVIIFCIKTPRDHPFISFAVLFYFYNHLVESTIIPLELVFEHRNYLPSFFLFLPVVALAVRGKQYYKIKNPSMVFIIHSGLIALLLFWGIGTYTRNIVWKSKKSLLIDNIRKAPNTARSYHNLASYLLRKEGDVNGALVLYKIALTKQPARIKQSQYATLAEIGRLQAHYQHDYESAIDTIRRSIELYPNSLMPKKNLVILLIKTGQFNEALENLQLLLGKRPAGYQLKPNEKISRYLLLNLQSLVYLKMDKHEKALTVSKEAFQLDAEGDDTRANLGMALSRTGKYEEADLLFRKIDLSQYRPELFIYLVMLENMIARETSKQANILIPIINERFSQKEILYTISKLYKEGPLQMELKRLLVIQDNF